MNNTMTNAATACTQLDMPIPVNERLAHTITCIDDINSILNRMVGNTFGEVRTEACKEEVKCMEDAVRYIESKAEFIREGLQLYSERMGV